WKLRGSVDEEQLIFRAHTIEASCPWGWAPGCLYNSYVFDAPLTNATSAKSVSHPVERSCRRASSTASTTYQNERSLERLCAANILESFLLINLSHSGDCTFTDWTKVIFFLEMWRAHGASHIFMYYHSSTHNVRQVLRHYEREVWTFDLTLAIKQNYKNKDNWFQGFVTVISWPLLPRFSNIDPNLSVYRLAHSLAHNDCVQRINSEFGALVDIDELIVPR
ncbi:hypothetical protein OSTOST_12441, partial [Ostertagia ostertagi]